MVDYSGKQTTAQRMIKSYGRRVTLQAPSTGGDFRSTTSPGKKKTTTALFTEFETKLIDGVDIKIGDKKCLIDERSLGSNGIEDFEILTEKDGTVWKIENINTIQPGDVKIYHEVQVRR